MVEIHAVYEGGLHTQCLHVPSGAALTTDAPLDNQGLGESFSPTDLVATGLATCMLTVMGIVAQRESWKIDGARVRIEKHMTSEPVRRIQRLVVRISLPAGLPKAARVALEQAADTCPVRQSIHPEIEVDARYDWCGAMS